MTVEEILTNLKGGYGSHPNQVSYLCEHASCDQLIDVLKCPIESAYRNTVLDELRNRSRASDREEMASLKREVIKLQKPHWTVPCTFWIVIFGTILSMIGVIISYLK